MIRYSKRASKFSARKLCFRFSLIVKCCSILRQWLDVDELASCDKRIHSYSRSIYRREAGDSAFGSGTTYLETISHWHATPRWRVQDDVHCPVSNNIQYIGMSLTYLLAYYGDLKPRSFEQGGSTFGSIKLVSYPDKLFYHGKSC